MKTNLNEFKSHNYGLEVSFQLDSLSTTTFDKVVAQSIECVYIAARDHCMTMFRIDYSECRSIIIEIGVDNNNLLSVSMWNVCWGQHNEHLYYKEMPLDIPSIKDYCAHILDIAYYHIDVSLAADYDRNGNSIEHSSDVMSNVEG